MPLYEYLCPQCQHKQEELIRTSPPPTIMCEKCGSVSERTVSRFVFRGDPENRSVDYKIEKAIDRAKDLRKQSEEASKMGSQPYEDSSIPEVDIVDQI